MDGLGNPSYRNCTNGTASGTVCRHGLRRDFRLQHVGGLADSAPADACETASGEEAAAKPQAEKPAAGKPAPAKPQAAAEEVKIKAAPEPEVPEQWVTLGSADEHDPYRMLVTLTNRGAAVARIELSSPRYCDIDNRYGYLGHLVMDSDDSPPRLCGAVRRPRHARRRGRPEARRRNQVARRQAGRQTASRSKRS